MPSHSSSKKPWLWRTSSTCPWLRCEWWHNCFCKKMKRLKRNGKSEVKALDTFARGLYDETTLSAERRYMYKVARMGFTFFLALLVAVPFPLLAQTQTDSQAKSTKSDNKDKNTKDSKKEKDK